MEEKDLILLKGKLREEYEAICRTDFWKNYIKRITQEMDIYIKHCLTDPPDNVSKYQGAVAATKRIMELPSRVLEVAPMKSE